MAEKKYLDYNGLTDVASHVNTRLKTVTSIPVSADNGAVRLYVGTTTATYIQGHIYQYNSTDSEWVDITSSYTAGNGINIENNEISADTVIFTGTQAEWDNLTTAQKQIYDICNITDDMSDFDGGGSSTLAGLSDVDIDTSTLADGQILQYDASSQKWVNASGAISPSKTVTVYSAANDTLTYSDLTGTKTVTTDANGVGTADIVCFDNTSITFTSSVAKNPSNLSAYYSKTVTVNNSTTSVNIMPDNALYWYGNQCTDLTGGWENPGTYLANSGTPEGGNTFNTNSITLSKPSGTNLFKVSGTNNLINRGSATKMYLVWSNSKHDFGITSANSFYVDTWAQNANGIYWQNVVAVDSGKNIASALTRLTQYSDYVSGTAATSKDLQAVWME